MKKSHIIRLLACLALSASFLVLYSCSRSSDNSKEAQIASPAPSNNEEHTGLSDSGEGQGQDGANKTTGKDEQRASVNHLPTVDKAKLQLEYANNKDIVRVVAVGTDKDNDPVTLGYEWSINGYSAGEGDTIGGFKRGDKLSVTITPFDGKDYGSPKTLSMDISNCPPKISEYKEIKFDGNTYTGQLNASDPDGDSLTYSLKSAPRGMTIDPSTGLLTWNVPPNFTGKVSFTVSVADGHGGESTQDLSFGILPIQEKKP